MAADTGLRIKIHLYLVRSMNVYLHNQSAVVGPQLSS